MLYEILTMINIFTTWNHTIIDSIHDAVVFIAWIIYSIIGSLYLFIPSLISPNPLPLMSTTRLSSVFMVYSWFGSCLFVHFKYFSLLIFVKIFLAILSDSLFHLKEGIKSYRTEPTGYIYYESVSSSKELSVSTKNMK